LFLLFLALFSSSGCLQTEDEIHVSQFFSSSDAEGEAHHAQPEVLPASPYGSETEGWGGGSSQVELKFASSVSQTLFRTWGTLILQGESPLPYLLLNATLRGGDRQVESTRYMLIGVEPGRSYDFDICERCRLRPDQGYTCLLELEGPEGFVASEERRCLVLQDDPQLVNINESYEANGGFPSSDTASGSLPVEKIIVQYVERPGQLPEQHEVPVQDEAKDCVGDYEGGESSGNIEHSEEQVASYSNEILENGGDSSRIEHPNDQEGREDAGFVSDHTESSDNRISSDTEVVRVDEASGDTENIHDAGLDAPSYFDETRTYYEESAQNQLDEEETKKYVGSINSDKYHFPDCRCAQKIKPENRIWFANAEDARAQGYVPCKVCDPP
jgi:hypothetical protein